MALTDQSHHSTTAPATRRTALLVLGDLAAFLLFSAIGRSSHGEAAGLSAILGVAGTAAPFMLGWFATAPFSGAYRGDAMARPTVMLRRTALAWLLAWPVGLVLRALLLQRGIPISFALVTLMTNMLILLTWRGAFAWLIQRNKA